MSVSYYRNRTNNQLIIYNLPLTTGFSGIRSNFPATIQNKGVEFELNTINVQKKDFKWSSSVNLSIPNNKLVSFPGIEASTYADLYIVGESIYIRKLYATTGVDAATGVYTFKDYNGDGKITSPDDNKRSLLIGQKFYGGFNNSFSYKNWNFDIFLQFVKQTGYNDLYGSSAASYPGVFANQPRYILDDNRWQQHGDKSSIQPYTTEYNAAARSASFLYQVSDAGIGDASFLRLKNVSLSYQLPSKWAKGSNCRAYLQAQNLYVYC
ncbi:MAG: hypothetical protein EOO92_24690 [Pedobacter sp.]|nr:MAG: hypothetical protein EOO92_24690 [Pedobacter sp.]